MFTDFGLSTKYPSDYLAGPIGGETTLETFNFNPNIAYRINDQWSVGAGASVVYGKAKLVRTLGILADAPTLRMEQTSLALISLALWMAMVGATDSTSVPFGRSMRTTDLV
ncbi:long-chain fatty acid transport protein [Vibrio ishigakensis]|uniref:Long-chain fatty acid transport protein n=1 Tax=Vibrio ishigakensis TaxID=1481914 RepID=A0A0B8PIC6_9VIBR|nr:long-chain fatty acid transport protein [Vibrio ishigakensis]